MSLSTTSSLLQLARGPFKRAQRGLFGGKQIQFGNSVPFSKTKTRRTWLPNVQTKRLFSETLNNWIRLNMTTHVIRTVDKKGGLDRYLLETKPELLGEKGMELRSLIQQVQKSKLENKKAVASLKSNAALSTPSSTSASSSSTAAAASARA